MISDTFWECRLGMIRLYNYILSPVLKPLSLLILFSFVSDYSYGQNFVGKLLSSENKKPIEYANIGLSNSKYGTYSNDLGLFSFDKKFLSDSTSILIRAIGFINRSVGFSSLHYSDTLVILMDPQVYPLEEIPVLAKRPSKVLIGKKRLPPKALGWSFAPGIGQNRLGKSIAVLININKNHLPINLYSASVAVIENPFNEGLFRAQFMSVHPKTGLPDSSLTKQNFITSFGDKEGWVTFDFGNKSPALELEQFYLVFENLNDSVYDRNPEQSNSPYPLFLLKGFLTGKDKILFSNASLSTWEEHKEDLVFNLRYTYVND
ncbi:MAG: hypothetical protein RIE52_00190 [Balneola sp.]